MRSSFMVKATRLVSEVEDQVLGDGKRKVTVMQRSKDSKGRSREELLSVDNNLVV